MKDLKTYILEAEEKEANKKDVQDSKEVTFDFTDLENADDTIKSLTDLSASGVEIKQDERKVTVSVTKEGVKNIDSIQDVLQQYYDTLAKSNKRTTDDTYAQKVKKFGENVDSLNDYIDEVEGSEE